MRPTRVLPVVLLTLALVVPAAAALAQTAPSPSPGATPSPGPTPSQGTAATPDPYATASPSPAPEPVRTVTEADSGSSVMLTIGQVLEVRLDGAWTGPDSTSALFLVRYRQTTDTTSARLQALRTTSGSDHLTATSDASCLHAQPACSIPNRSWTLDVTVTGPDDGSGSYPCYGNPSPSPAAGTVVLTERDNGRTVQVEQGRFVGVSLNGCDPTWRIPVSSGPLFRETASYEANGNNASAFRAVSPGRATITSRTDRACYRVPSERACAPGDIGFTVDVEVVASTCPATLEVPDSLTATGSAPVVVHGAPGRQVTLFAYSRPSTTYRLVRQATLGSDGTVTFQVRPPTNTRLYALADGCEAGPSVVLNVRTALTMTAERLGSRTYRFAGDSLPARPGGLIVSLYRVTDDGREVLTAQARADAATGEWSLDRRFTGAGRFGFGARTGQDLTNAPGASNTRSTLVY